MLGCLVAKLRFATVSVTAVVTGLSKWPKCHDRNLYAAEYLCKFDRYAATGKRQDCLVFSGGGAASLKVSSSIRIRQ
jgi:hypothetical protein